jgi:hypothetical protein
VKLLHRDKFACSLMESQMWPHPTLQQVMQRHQTNACLQRRLRDVVKSDGSMNVSVNIVELLAGEPKARRANAVEVGEDLEEEFI